MELRDFSKWRIANLYVAIFLVAGAIVSSVPARPLWFGFITDHMVNIALSVITGVAVNMITRSLVSAFADYEPSTFLQAKRANEQIKMMATFSNAIATAVVAILALGQLSKEGHPEYYKISLGVLIAAMIHAGGRNLLALLKAERSDDLAPISSDIAK